MRRLLALLLAALLVLSAGCSALFDKEVYAEAPYEVPSDAAETGDDGNTDTISNYAALRRVLLRLVSERVESAVLQFQNYEGTVSRDISTACWEVKSSTALGAFAVDYISYDLSRIVSYTQAEVHITYKRSGHQMSALEEVANLTALRARVEEALRAGETYLVLEVTAASLTADTVRQSVERAYYADPLACPVLPAAEASLYPDTGMTRIVEASLDYGLDGAELAARREELAAALEAFLLAALPEDAEEEALSGEEPAEETDASAEPADGPLPADDPLPSDSPESVLADAERVRRLCAALAQSCLWDEAAGATAWDALTAGAASSEGLAMALEAACQALGLECRVVFGRLDGEDHAWNIVTVGEAAYHVDVSRWDAGEEHVFLMGDEDLWGLYWWDTSEYPACPARFGASEEPSAEIASAEPADTPEEADTIEN